MKNNIRRFAAILSLTVILGSTPAFAGPARDKSGVPDRPSIVRIINKLMQRFFGLKPMADAVIPIPGPNANGD